MSNSIFHFQVSEVRRRGGGGGIRAKLSVPVGASRVYMLFTNEMFALLDRSHGGKAFLVRDSGTGVPLLTGAAAPWRPSRAGGGDASHSVIPMTLKFGGRVLSTTDVEEQHRVRGF